MPIRRDGTGDDMIRQDKRMPMTFQVIGILRYWLNDGSGEPERKIIRSLYVVARDSDEALLTAGEFVFNVLCPRTAVRYEWGKAQVQAIDALPVGAWYVHADTNYKLSCEIFDPNGETAMSLEVGTLDDGGFAGLIVPYSHVDLSAIQADSLAEAKRQIVARLRERMLYWARCLQQIEALLHEA